MSTSLNRIDTDKFHFNHWGGKERKFLCIGGLYDGQYLSRTQVGDDYDTFNSSSAPRRYRAPHHKQVHIYRGLLYPNLAR